MKIYPTGAPNYIAWKRKNNSVDKAAVTSSGFPSGDELTMSADVLSFAKIFAAVKEANLASSATEPARVSEIAAQIADGSYLISSEAVASSIFGDMDD